MSKILSFLKKEYVLIFILLGLAIVSRFLFFGYPKQVVFDEVHFGKFVSRYFDGKYYFDIHPPLAKLIMSSSAKLFNKNIQDNFNFEKIGDNYPDSIYKIYRFIVSFFGVLLVLAIYFLSKALFNNKWIGFLAGLLAIFDNALIVQSRFILTDVFFLSFGVASLALIIYSFKTKNKYTSVLLFVLGSVLSSCAISVKWTALVFVATALISIIYFSIRNKNYWQIILKPILFISIIFVVYFSVFAIHINLLPNSGDGDDYMSSAFVSTLSDSAHFGKFRPENQPSLWNKFTELNQKMLSYNKSITAPHPDGSKWFAWPFGQKKIFFWTENINMLLAPKIYLSANLWLWEIGLVSIVIGIFYFLFNLFKKGFKNEENFGLFLLLSGYFGNLFAYLFVSRVAFIYHYFPSLIFLIICLSYFISKKKYLWVPVLILVIYNFYTLFATTYGIGYSF